MRPLASRFLASAMPASQTPAQREVTALEVIIAGMEMRSQMTAHRHPRIAVPPLQWSTVLALSHRGVDLELDEVQLALKVGLPLYPLSHSNAGIMLRCLEVLECRVSSPT